MRYVAAGCAFGVGLAFAVIIGLPGADHAEKPAPIATRAETAPGPCDGDIAWEVSELVEARDVALRESDAPGLLALSGEGSKARADDEALLASMAGYEILTLSTRVDAVTIVSCEDSVPAARLEVWTTQEILEIQGEEPVGELPSRCAQWDVAGIPWRVEAVSECVGD
ncbi:MAG: hypothetical protein ACTH1Z_02510 [Ancrocorticia sp.]|uniref:hypothetical protein n=1 Tax=Ancrocorticia sp. TaxID=2593684 RepID=UPI003F93E280